MANRHFPVPRQNKSGAGPKGAAPFLLMASLVALRLLPMRVSEWLP
jgi:hypothetical protein